MESENTYSWLHESKNCLKIAKESSKRSATKFAKNVVLQQYYCLYSNTLFYKQPSYKQPVLRFSANYNIIQYTNVVNNNREQKKYRFIL